MSLRPWTLRATEADDLPAIRRLFVDTFGYERPLAHDRWKFFGGASGPGIGMVAVDAGRIVGQYALLPTPLRLGAEVVVGAQSLDTMTLPAYRGQGMFVALAQACIERAIQLGIEVVYGFPNASSYPGFVRRLNCDHCGDVPRWIRPLSGGAWQRLPGWARPLMGLAVHALPIGGAGNSDIQIVPGAPEPAALEQLLAGGREPVACGVDWSLPWVHWRFSAEATRGYQWIHARRDGVVSAAVVWGHRTECEAVLSAVLGDDHRALSRCVGAAVRAARQAGFTRMVSASNVPTVMTALRRGGFLRHGVLPLIVRSMTTRTLSGNIHDFPSWRIRPADVDTL